jgi:hypothetical protein
MPVAAIAAVMVADFPVHPPEQPIIFIATAGRDGILGHGIYGGAPASESVDDCRYTVTEALEQPNL